ncbi:cytochrome C assembly family protein [Amphibiibacter pelophylacis]|uniref:Cytochrome c biogenesis protein CcsA n=1 Tax=Amphibiibacter pelophylacis TaxID=1799477 RepID=A0ACC6NZ88_9BURK
MILANPNAWPSSAHVLALVAWLAAGVALLAYLRASRSVQPLPAAHAAPDAAPAQPVRDRVLLLAWLMHGLLLAFDLTGLRELQPGPHFGFGSVLSATVWLVLLVHLMEGLGSPWQTLRQPLALLGLAGVMLALLFPGEYQASAANIWAPLHWLMGVCAYALVAVAVVHAVLLGRAERALRHGHPPPWLRGMPLLRLERLTFRFVQAGCAVLALAIVLGAVSGPDWAWTHKTVFSLLSWAVLAVLLLGRWRQGWRGATARRWLYASALLLLLAYAGSRFVLEVLLGRGPV